MEKKIHFANTCFLIPFKLQHLFLNDKRGKNVTTKFSKIAKLVGEKWEKVVAHVTRQLDFCRFPANPSSLDIYFHMSLESATADLHDLS